MRLSCWPNIARAIFLNKSFYLIVHKSRWYAVYHGSSFTLEKEAREQYKHDCKFSHYGNVKLYHVHAGRYELIEEYKA